MALMLRQASASGRTSGAASVVLAPRVGRMPVLSAVRRTPFGRGSPAPGDIRRGSEEDNRRRRSAPRWIEPLDGTARSDYDGTDPAPLHVIVGPVGLTPTSEAQP
jgi:hypothetical protein